MDPLSQACLGAAAAALVSRKENVRLALIVGAVAGAAPDLDVLIRSEKDPLLSLEYHRHFTHALLFAPIIGMMVAAVFKAILFKKVCSFRMLACFAILGALTHGLLDACTSYGTLLYLPFSSHRESWDIISIIDPIFTLPLFILCVLAFAWRRPGFAIAALVSCALYLCFGLHQKARATDFAQSLAESRGHQASSLTARPSFANTLLWRIIYRDGDRYYVDAVTLLPGTAPRPYPGQSVVALTPEDVGKILPPNSVLAQDVERFRVFSQGYLYRYPEDPTVIGDLRYAMLPNSIEPLWGIRIDPQFADQHTQMVYLRNASKSNWDQLWLMLCGAALAEN